METPDVDIQPHRQPRHRDRAPSLSELDHNAYDEDGNLKCTSLNTGARHDSLSNLVEPIKDAREGSFSYVQVMTLINLCLVTFVDAVCYSLLSPFYPAEAASKGVDGTVIGLIFGVFELVIFLTSPIFGAYLTRIGSRFMLISGIFTCGVTAILFGFLDGCPDGWQYVLMNFLVRTVEAVGASAFITASFAIVANTFPSRVATMFGALETFNGLGMMTGPMIGGLLYQVGGFKLPFLVTGSILLVAGVVTIFILPAQHDTPKAKSSSLLRLLSIPTVMVLCVVLVVDACTLGFMQPTLAGHLEQFNLSTAVIGVVFFVAPALYAGSSPFWGWVSDKWGFRSQLFITGSIGVGVAYVLMGPCPLIMEKSELWLVIISLVLMGFCIGAAFVPLVNECVKVAIDHGYPDDFETYGLVSGIINCCFSLGGFIGPIGGGALVQQIGFDWSSAIMGFTVLALQVLVIIFYIGKRVRKRSLSYTSLNESLEQSQSSVEPNARTPLLGRREPTV